MTTYEILTPPGTGAIAVVAISGAKAWHLVKQKFSTKTKLPDLQQTGSTYFGTIGDGTFADEVVLTITDDLPTIEIHCHGGRRVVKWVTELFALEEQSQHNSASPWYWLERAPTLRTANIILEQCHGAWDNPTTKQLVEAKRWAKVGAHLVVPYTVVVSGAPNAGKSSLVNAIAGFTRSVVDATAGTTRDVVRTTVALDGWPVELWDTAGLRNATETIEAEGVERAILAITQADAVVAVLDSTAPLSQQPTPPANSIVVVNKIDLPAVWDTKLFPDALMVSANTGAGIGQLTGTIVRLLVPEVPPSGAMVPFSPELSRSLLL